MTLKSLTEWMELFTSPERTYNDAEKTVHAYGEADSSYIVLERALSDSPRSSLQYVLHAPEKSNRLYTLLQFLNESNFDLDNLFKRLNDAHYEIQEMNEVARIDGFLVARYEIQENTQRLM